MFLLLDQEVIQRVNEKKTDPYNPSFKLTRPPFDGLTTNYPLEHITTIEDAKYASKIGIHFIRECGRFSWIDVRHVELVDGMRKKISASTYQLTKGKIAYRYGRDINRDEPFPKEEEIFSYLIGLMEMIHDKEIDIEAIGEPMYEIYKATIA